MDRARVLKVLGSDHGSHYEVVLSGSISESSELEVAGVPANRYVVVDVAGVTSINSMGIRTWTNFVGALSAISKRVALRGLSPTMVTQAGMVKNFLGAAVVESFFAPYCCEECGHERLELFSSHAEVPDSLPCPECGEQMLFDDLRETYLAFRAEAEEADTVEAPPPSIMRNPGSSEEPTTTSGYSS